jgi:hypothetical protein
MEVPALEKLLSTEEKQFLAREEWPKSIRSKQDVTEMRLTPVLDPPATSTGSLSTGHLHSYIDAERVATKGKPFRYYRYHFAETIDHRLFQWSVPDKDVEYGHHRDERPPWFGSYRSMST